MKITAPPLLRLSALLALSLVAGPASAKPSEAAILTALSDMARQLNQSMPKDLDANMRIDSVVASRVSPPKFTYNYTLNAPLRQINAVDYLGRLRAPLVQAVCTHPDMQIFRDLGVTVVYSYRANDGVLAGTIEASPADCQ